jgi:phosphoribosylglycinamide formyltransferase-1
MVISNRKNAPALKKAEAHGIPTAYVPAKKGESREDYDRRLEQEIERCGPELIVLAGFLRILSSWFVRRHRWKIINIHPSLLPAFGGLYGLDVHAAVLEHGCKVSGCTVHFVDEKVDHGPIIIQKCVGVKESDTPETLARRVLEKEHEALVEAVKLIAEGRVHVSGNIAKINHDTD